MKVTTRGGATAAGLLLAATLLLTMLTGCEEAVEQPSEESGPNDRSCRHSATAESKTDRPKTSSRCNWRHPQYESRMVCDIRRDQLPGVLRHRLDA